MMSPSVGRLYRWLIQKNHHHSLSPLSTKSRPTPHPQQLFLSPKLCYVTSYLLSSDWFLPILPLLRLTVKQYLLYYHRIQEATLKHNLTCPTFCSVPLLLFFVPMQPPSSPPRIQSSTYTTDKKERPSTLISAFAVSRLASFLETKSVSSTFTLIVLKMSDVFCRRRIEQHSNKL